MSLGTNLYRLRTQRNLTQGDLAEALEVSRQSVSKWETDGAVPDLDKLVKLSALFGVTLDELVTGTVPDAPTESEEPSAPGPAAAPSPGWSGRKIAAVVLLCMAFVVALVFLLLGGLLEGLVLALPFLCCGLICLAARRHPGLWCCWALFFLADLYLRYATGITWRIVLLTPQFTPEMNYTRLAIGWVQLLCALALAAATAAVFRKRPLTLTRGGWIGMLCGWVAFFAVNLLPVRPMTWLIPVKLFDLARLALLAFLLSLAARLLYQRRQ
jgi:transcriptional regulator with XRE-family HTH domain